MYTEQAAELTTRISAVQPDSWELYSDDDRRAVQSAATLIAALAGDHAVEYVDHNRDTADEDANGARILAFTAEVLIIIKLSTSGGNWILTTEVLARAALHGLSISSLSNAVEPPAGIWPTKIRATLEYSNGLLLTLPFRVTGTGPQRQELAQLLSGLAIDLGR